MTLTNTLYRLARMSATARAASKGPVPLAKRYVRRSAWRQSSRVTRRILRGFGL